MFRGVAVSRTGGFNGNCRQFACRAVSISATNLILATSVSAAIRERVVAYFEEFGEI